MKLMRFAGAWLLCLLSPLMLACGAMSLLFADVLFAVFGRKRAIAPAEPRHDSASIVIPNWNGRALLEKCLPSVMAAVAGDPNSEVIVVDNASSDDSVQFIETTFPQVTLIRCEKNLGFGGGVNLGVRNAKNDIVVLLNNDMRVEADFLRPLLKPFADPLVFSVSCRIYFSDPDKLREETGLTQGWWERGRLCVTHRVEDSIQEPFPCFYAGGGSSAYDRRKFLELGGFDGVFKPFYYEDTDLGYMAWKRGWKVLYQPGSVVYHEHRGTIARVYSDAAIQGTLKRNAVVFIWKNIHDWRLLPGHFANCFASSLRSLLSGDTPGAFSFPGLAKAFVQIPGILRARWRARRLSMIPDQEALHRPLGSFFRDRFDLPGERLPERLRLLFVTPYAIEPPVHGGAVFMKLAIEELSKSAEIHLAGMVDRPEELPCQHVLSRECASVCFQIRRPQSRLLRNRVSLKPHAVQVYEDKDFAWTLHRIVFEKKIDAIQLEYVQFAQYANRYRHIPVFLFEHDLYFQSIRRQLKNRLSWDLRLKYGYEYLRALRYEYRTLPKLTRVQVCSEENAQALRRLSRGLKTRIDADIRVGIRADRYPFRLEPREPNTMLFVGNLRHNPNVEALEWFVTEVMPRITARNPRAVLVIVGTDAPQSIGALNRHPGIRFTGYVEDVCVPLSNYAVFVCPILSGSGIRVKLLEAFAAGIPVVSTSLGAEGFVKDGIDFCEIADTARDFAEAVLRLLAERAYAGELATRARRIVETQMDGAVVIRRLLESYRREAKALRGIVGSAP